jgi:hypothetical protein
MKNLLLTVFLYFFFVASFGQNGPTLTKGETVDYLNKKFREGINFKGNSFYLTKASLSMNDCSITYMAEIPSELKEPSYPEDNLKYSREHLEYKFNPMHIKEITTYSQDNAASDIGRMVITLENKTAQVTTIIHEYVRKSFQKRHWDAANYREYFTTEYYYAFEPTTNTVESMKTVTIFYLKSDSSNFNKLKKAFEHLRKLCKADDDPFGN